MRDLGAAFKVLQHQNKWNHRNLVYGQRDPGESDLRSLLGWKPLTSDQLRFELTKQVSHHTSDRSERSGEASFNEILMIKRRARDRLVEVVCAADGESLELAAGFVKAALRGNETIRRPQRFSCLDNEEENAMQGFTHPTVLSCRSHFDEVHTRSSNRPSLRRRSTISCSSIV